MGAHPEAVAACTGAYLHHQLPLPGGQCRPGPGPVLQLLLFWRLQVEVQGGSIEQIQVKQDILVTLCTFAPSFQQEDSTQGLTMSFVPSFKEVGVFRVIPDMKSKVYLRTPN